MDDAVGLELRKIIGRYGSDVSEDPRRVDALLRDLSGEHRREIFVLVGAARERVPAKLLASGVTVPGPVLNQRLSQMLQDNLGLSKEVARWAVATWASALDVTASAPRPTASGAASAPRPTASGAASAPRPTASGVKASGWRLAGKLAALTGGVIFLASIALFKNYTNLGPGPVSLYKATHGDYWSPLYAHNFWTVITLLALTFVLTMMSFGAAGRPLMSGATLAALGLAGYTLYIPTINSAGFSAYGSSYWISLVAAVVMALGAGLAAAIPAM